MPSQVPHEIVRAMAEAYLQGATVGCALLIASTTVPTNPDHQFLAAVVADEADGTGYERAVVSGVSIDRDIAADEVYFRCSDVLFALLGVDNGPIEYVVFYIDAASDATRRILVVHDITDQLEADRTPDGEDFYVRPGSQGFMKGIVT